MSLEIVTLDDSHLEAAAGLVCARYRELRRQEPLLPERYEREAEFLPKLNELAGSAPGVMALRSGQLAGFMVAYLVPRFLGVPAAYSPEWANAVEPQDGQQIYEEMYAYLSRVWVERGCYTHAFTLFTNDTVGLEALQWLTFGRGSVDGIRPLKALETGQTGLDIRRAGEDDHRLVDTFFRKLEQHLGAAPVFWPHRLGESLEWLRDPGNAMFLAERGGKALGCLGIGPASQEACTIIQDEGTASIVSAYTLEEERGNGVATALVEQALGWARRQGYTRCGVDFEAMNIPARRFWLRWFRPVCYSMIRSINPQVFEG